MKKSLAILLLFAFWFSIVGYFHVFKLMQAEIRHTIKVKLEKQLPDKELTLLSFSSSEKINWIRKDKELRYHGKMYDVVRKAEKNGVITLFCIDDHKESRLVSTASELLKENAGNDKDSPANSLRNLVNLLPILFHKANTQIFYIAGNPHFLPDQYFQTTLEGYLEEPSPPPVAC